MKKLMMMGLALALVCSAQAATINWSNNGTTTYGIKTAVGGTLLPAGSTVWLVYLGSDGVFDPLVDLGTGPQIDAVADGADTFLAATSTFGAPSRGGYDGGGYTFTYGTGPGQYNDGDVFAVVAFDAVNSLYGVSATYTIPTGSDNTLYTEFITSSWTTSTPYPEPIPEPATAGLIGLGLAAIALRRRFRK